MAVLCDPLSYTLRYFQKTWKIGTFTADTVYHHPPKTTLIHKKYPTNRQRDKNDIMLKVNMSSSKSNNSFFVSSIDTYFNKIVLAVIVEYYALT